MTMAANNRIQIGTKGRCDFVLCRKTRNGR
jgi:hypothetical protein